ncbi:hypothetical protein PVAG01_00374 [Phlyctema vagabunda]|uniref:Uncharacterized protein n=1 Tax=Phlyctema vagabunda TaxID=108571 RepID=A0ABR4PU15_9HELO
MGLWAALMPQVSANFDIYFVDDYSIIPTVRRYQVFEAQANCAQSQATRLFTQLDDVSGNKLGVRCKGGQGCYNGYAPADDIEQLEMNFGTNPVYHWTLYKNADRYMVGLDGKTYGHCIIFPDGDFDCPLRHGYRKFRCLTSFTANQLNGV